MDGSAMTPEDVSRIEHALEISLPETYASIVLDYPCAHSKEICEYGFFKDPEWVIKRNEQHRTDGWFGIDWPRHYFVIGEDGAGNTYFMVLGEDESVYFADHEAGPHPVQQLEECLAFETLQEHVDNEIRIDLEFEEEDRVREEQKRNKRWWQFWL